MTTDDRLATLEQNTHQIKRDAVRAFSAWLWLNWEPKGYGKSFIQKLKVMFAEALAKTPVCGTSCPVEIFRDPGFQASLNEMHNYDAVKQLLSVLSEMEQDSMELRLSDQVFSFSEINPGLGAFGLAAMNVGGIPHGSRLTSPSAQPTFVTNRGRDSLLAPDVPVDINLVNLPFSAFVGIGQPDPAIVKIIEEAAAYRKQARCTLFRVDWTVGKRLNTPEDGYRKLISRLFVGSTVQSHTVDVELFVPMEGHELFVFAAPKIEGTFGVLGSNIATRLASSYVGANISGDLEPSEIPMIFRKFPRQHAGRIDSDYWNEPSAAIVQTKTGYRRLSVSEVKGLLGINPDFQVTSHEPTAYHLLGESVVVPVAERAIRSVLRALR